MHNLRGFCWRSCLSCPSSRAVVTACRVASGFIWWPGSELPAPLLGQKSSISLIQSIAFSTESRGRGNGNCGGKQAEILRGSIFLVQRPHQLDDHTPAQWCCDSPLIYVAPALTVHSIRSLLPSRIAAMVKIVDCLKSPQWRPHRELSSVFPVPLSRLFRLLINILHPWQRLVSYCAFVMAVVLVLWATYCSSVASESR